MAAEKNVKSYENCCRTCMNEDSTMFDIFINTLNSTNLADILTSCTRLNVSRVKCFYAVPKKKYFQFVTWYASSYLSIIKILLPIEFKLFSSFYLINIKISFIIL